MKITSSSPNFTSRNIYIRRADDIVRHTNLQYPMFSPHYANNAWLSAKFYTKSLDRKSEIFHSYLIPKLNQYRDECDKTQDTDKFHLDILRKAKEYKIGNCDEKTLITMGALAVNGYTHFCKVVPIIKINAIDKRTGKVAFVLEKQYDHCAIATSMKDEGGNIKKSIIIDPYFNKAMTYNEAQIEYLNLIPRWEIEDTIEEAENKIINFSEQKYGALGKKLPFDFDIKNYEFKPEVVLKKSQNCLHNIENPDEAKEFGELIKQEFPELTL